MVQIGISILNRQDHISYGVSRFFMGSRSITYTCGPLTGLSLLTGQKKRLRPQRTEAANYREFPGKPPTRQQISPEVPFSLSLLIVTSFHIRAIKITTALPERHSLLKSAPRLIWVDAIFVFAHKKHCKK
jgi:hypothetical protein